MKDTLAILKDAYEIIRDKNRWTTRVAARDAHGLQINPWEDGAVRFCAAGAIWKASGLSMDNGSYPDAAFNALQAGLGGQVISTVNDGPDGYDLICAGFRKTIADLTPKTERRPAPEKGLAKV